MARGLTFILIAGLMFIGPLWAGEAENQVLAQVNAARAQKGCRALTMDSRLSKSAYGHAKAMAEKNFFSHTGANGSSSKSRAHAAGYYSNFIGENVAMGQSSSAEVFSNWISSKGHRDNILDCRFTETGIGVFYQADDKPLPGRVYAAKYYWVEVFARP
jgi:uncharacterized protein YkwD